jgi:hypothetical protein
MPFFTENCQKSQKIVIITSTPVHLLQFERTINAYNARHRAQQHCYVFPKKPNTLAGFEPGSSVPQADAMTSAL